MQQIAATQVSSGRRSRMVPIGAALAVGVVVATAIASQAQRFWFADLLVHFRVQYAAIAALAFALLAVRRRWSLALFAAVACGVNIHAVATQTPRGESLVAPAASAAEGGGAARLRVVSANVLFVNRDHGLLLRWLAAQDADAIVLQEITPEWRAALAPLRERYRFEAASRADATIVWILSRLPLRRVETVDLGARSSRAVRAILDVKGRELQLLGVHLTWPMRESLAAARNGAMRRVAAIAAAASGPLLVTGDMNCSPYSPHFARLLRDGGLRSAAAIEGWQPTWPSLVAPLGLQIDHALVRGGSLRVDAFRRGAWIGSDHLPIVVDITLY